MKNRNIFQRSLSLILSLTIISMSIIPAIAKVSKTTIANINDVNLKAVLNQSISEKTGEKRESTQDIKISELNLLDGTLNYNQKGISDLSGLEHIVNVSSLNLGGNNISDITPISNLSNLKILRLNNNKLKDISGLSNLKNLNKLFVNSNSILDISMIPENIELKAVSQVYNDYIYIDGTSDKEISFPFIDRKEFSSKAESSIWISNTRRNITTGEKILIKSEDMAVSNVAIVYFDNGIDFSGRYNITFTDVNKEDLQSLIGKANEKNSSDYTEESWNKLQEALENAKKVVDNQNATNEQVKEATEKLESALNNLQQKPLPVDKSKLQDIIEHVTTEFVNTDYSSDSWKELSDAVDNGKILLGDLNATQEQIDKAFEDIKEKILKLDPIITFDREALKKAIEDVSKLDKTLYDPELWSKVEDLLEDAQEMLHDYDVLKSQVDKMVVYLGQTYDILSYITILNIFIDFVENKLVSTDFTQESWNDLANSVELTKEVLNDIHTITYEKLDSSFKDLKEKFENLVEAPVDKTALINLINSAPKNNDGKYTEESWNKFEEALKRAEEVRDNKNATQEEVNKAFDDLKAAQKIMMVNIQKNLGINLKKL